MRAMIRERPRVGAGTVLVAVILFTSGCLVTTSDAPPGPTSNPPSDPPPDPPTAGDPPVTPLPPPAPAGGTAPAAVPTPDVIFGADLALWLDARVSSSIESDKDGHLTRWLDRSGHKHHANTYGSWAPSVVPAFVDGQATLHFAWPNGQSSSALRAPSLGLVAKDATVIVVAAQSSALSVNNRPMLLLEGTLYSPESGLALYGANPTSTQAHARVGKTWLSSVRDGWNDEHLHVFTLVRAGTTMTLRVDGESSSAPGPGYMQPYSGWQEGTWIGGFFVDCAEGCSHGVYDRLEGDIAEVIVAHTSPSQAANSALEMYIGARYGLPF